MEKESSYQKCGDNSKQTLSWVLRTSCITIILGCLFWYGVEIYLMQQRIKSLTITLHRLQDSGHVHMAPANDSPKSLMEVLKRSVRSESSKRRRNSGNGRSSFRSSSEEIPSTQINSALSGSSTTPAATSTAAAAAAAVINGTVTPPGVLFSSLSENPTSADSKLPLTSGFTTDFPFLDFLKNSKPTDEIDSLFSGLATVPYSDLEDHSSSFVPDIKTLSKLVIDTSGGATTAGSTFTRWGLPSCPHNAHAVYSGYAAAAYDAVGYGGSTELECLPLDPTWHKNANSSSQSSSNTFITAAKFYLGSHTDVFKLGSLPDNQVIPCAVCLIVRSPVLMIPGRVECPSQWMMEYSGYLMSTPGVASEYYFSSKNYCVDNNPDFYTGHNDAHGLKLTFVQAGHCYNNELPCRDYTRENILGCTVCSKL